MNASRTLRSLDKERYLIKIGDKAIAKLEEPFKDMIKEYNRFKRENMDDEGNVGDMDFEDNDLFGTTPTITTKFTYILISCVLLL
jgi:hypothetical protein